MLTVISTMPATGVDPEQQQVCQRPARITDRSEHQQGHCRLDLRGCENREKLFIMRLLFMPISGIASKSTSRSSTPFMPFRTMDNVLATPHIGYVTENLYRTFYGDAVTNITAWLDK